MAEEGNIGGCGTDFADAFFHPLRDTAGWIVRGGRYFPDLHLAGVLFKQTYIGKRTAGIHANAPDHEVPLLVLRPFAPRWLHVRTEEKNCQLNSNKWTINYFMVRLTE
ncbi:hypothetical protein D3C73_1032330 [compost metagenome]